MAKAKTPFTTPYLEFRYKKVVMIDLGDAKQYIIPCETKYSPVPLEGNRLPVMHGMRITDENQMVLLPHFDLTKVHKVELQDELPRVPKKLPGMSDAHHGKLCDMAYEKAARAKSFNDEVRRRVNSYVANGTLEVVSDPFENQEEVEGLAELAAAFKEADEAANGKP